MPFTFGLAGNFDKAMTVELDEGEKAALIAELKRIIAADPFPMSPRVRQLRAILEKLEPPAARPRPLSSAEAGRHTKPFADAEERTTPLARLGTYRNASAITADIRASTASQERIAIIR